MYLKMSLCFRFADVSISILIGVRHAAFFVMVCPQISVFMHDEAKRKPLVFSQITRKIMSV